ncbi:MAG TPA: hypothetical protein VFL27_06810 [Candidatus Dormibacteraeota bacterium]|nr:hypothetical protein [Candidatus Dormibacteraeota bacterium]
MTYRLAGYRFLILVLLSGFAVLAVALLVVALDSADRGLQVFSLAWVAGVVWTAYWGLTRYACEIGISGSSNLRWCSVTRCHELPTSAIRGVSTPWRLVGAGLRRIDVDGGSSPILIASPGLVEVIAMIERSRPDLVLRASSYDRLAARFGRRTLQWRRL